MDALQDGERFGPYRPVRKLGQGATSVVFEGRRESKDFARRVAIKVILGKIPASIPESETQLLAQLEHPNIARFLDAGSTESGMRFLVMEYVEGVPCKEYVQQRGLDEAATLKVFLEICDAVQYANRSLVIHCDLKPANILVGADGRVKLLDFGIARVLTELTEKDSETRQRYYSPEYASPEQIEGKRLTVATDVYSLGVLLSELTGVKPGAGDLGSIAAKARQHEAAHRYGSVAELAADVRRYLEGRAVEARGPSRLYQMWRFAARYRVMLAVSAAALAGLLLVTGFALRQRSLATERFQQVRGLAHSVLYEIHDEIAKLPASLGARHLLANRSVEYLDALARSAKGDDAIQLEAAKGYLRLADVEGVGNEPSLGQGSTARKRLEEADRLVRLVIQRNPGSIDGWRARYQTLEALAVLYTQQGDARDVATGEELVRVAEANWRRSPGDGTLREERAHALSIVADSYTKSRTQGERGVRAWARAVGEWKRLYEERPTSLVRKRELARAYQYQAGALSRASRREEARATIQIAYRMHQELAKVPGEEVEHLLAVDVGLLANLTAQMRRYKEAIPLFQEQLRLRERVAARDPKNLNARMGVAGTLDRIGFAHVLLNQPEEGVPYLERALSMQREVYAQDPENVLINREMLYVLSDLTDAHEVLKRRDRMCAYAREAVALIPGPISRTRETATDKGKKAYVKKIAEGCAKGK